MTEFMRRLGSRAIGLDAEDEDMWRLVFDAKRQRLYVEHLWDHVSKSDGGRRELEIGEFLASEQVEGKAELPRLIEGLFESEKS